MKIGVWFTLTGVTGSIMYELEIESIDDDLIKEAIKKELDNNIADDIKKKLGSMTPKIFFIEELSN